METIKFELEDCDIIASIKVKSFTLLVCFGSENYIDKDNSIIQDAIKSDIDEAFDSFIRKIDDKTYYIEIKPNVQYGNFPWEDGWAKDLLNKQLTIYMPLIQKFISDAMTNTIRDK